MKTKRKSSVYLAGLALLGSIALSGTTAEADVTMNVTAAVSSSIVETVVTQMNFGSMDFVPAGDLIRIDASSSAGTPTVATGPSNGSVVTGGTSGLIQVAAAIDLTITITYPANTTVAVTDGTTTVYLDNIATYSVSSVTHTANTVSDIHVGGELDFVGVTPSDGTYTGSFTVTLNYS